MLRRIGKPGCTGHGARGKDCGQIIRYGVAKGRCDRDPASDLRGALPPRQAGTFRSITEPAAAGELVAPPLTASRHPRGECALTGALVLRRPVNCACSNGQFDLQKGEWRYS